MRRVGRGCLAFERPPALLGRAAVGGKREAQGPLGADLDKTFGDTSLGMDTWEQAEAQLQKEAVALALARAGLGPEDLDLIFAGDLLNQCISSTFGVMGYQVPFLGQYGACSTMAQALLLAALAVESGAARQAAAVTSSHFCSAERQFRLPLEYGGQRSPTAQWTATAAGCTILGSDGPGPYVTHVTCGRIVDKGIADANNMGAAMAPAAYDTLSAFFRDTGYKPTDFDLILTGDLGELGHAIVRDFFQRDGVDMGPQFQDCGLLLYDRKHQDMHAGASGCGCSASVLNGYLLRKMREGKWKTILFAPTGALLSPTSSGQGESIPSICHAVRLCAVRE